MKSRDHKLNIKEENKVVFLKDCVNSYKKQSLIGKVLPYLPSESEKEKFSESVRTEKDEDGNTMFFVYYESSVTKHFIQLDELLEYERLYDESMKNLDKIIKVSKKTITSILSTHLIEKVQYDTEVIISRSIILNRVFIFELFLRGIFVMISDKDEMYFVSETIPFSDIRSFIRFDDEFRTGQYCMYMNGKSGYLEIY